MEKFTMTAAEARRLAGALRQPQFREMLDDYVQEVSDPDNRRKYEEEIQLLEQQRGFNVEFIHPKPFRAIESSMNGQRCFINICSSEKVGRPECQHGVTQEGCGGQHWVLPQSLIPGREDTDGKGNKILIYDVVFHPDTLHMAGKNRAFMDMVDNVAIQEIQKAFKVTVDHQRVKEVKAIYKGTPQPCVIRRPIPGAKADEPSEQPDPLAFPYPDETNKPQTKAGDLPATQHRTDSDPERIPVQPVKTQQPIRPNYTLTYRSFIDLQDFRYSRRAARSPRPKEIVVTIDLPLLQSTGDAVLEVKDKLFLLESKRAAYRLELPLAYPVDQDKGEAKFNKQKKQLTVTLPVLPLHPSAGWDHFQSLGEETQTRGEEDEESELDGPDTEGNREGNTAVTPESGEETPAEQETEGGVREETLLNQDQPEEEDTCDGAAEESDCVDTGFQCEASVSSLHTEAQLAPTSVLKEEEENQTASFNFSDVQEKSEITPETQLGNMQECLTASVPNHDVPEAAGSQPPDGGPDQRCGEACEERQQRRAEDQQTPAASIREVDQDGKETIITDHSTSAGFIFHNSLVFELD